ncbi:MAG TPA: hydantoinase B/oxoprolinase family protein [Miltoncostaeaceae bacterium]|jgi:N-methylhydantoinase B|nr:hydantoinase B/oxoprolinase family protein [Miltoncostaeaceae bacterium]
MSEEIVWDGRTYPYIPPAELRIAPGLTLHDEADATIDPVTHEVLRHALWNVNTEHGNTIMKISGSPICAYGHDFNPCILDEKGDFVFFGPFLQYLSAAVGNAVKWTLENRSDNPGIADGDMWLSNDPWIGATHQSDVVVMAPVFHEGRVFCWVANTLHQWDLGGTAPGGFNPFAQDVFWESPCIPPVKILEGDVIRRDIEEMYLRSSRMPDLVRLDLRAEITGCRIARDRILEMIGRYGAGTVKATMRKLQDDSEAAFLRRMDTIPDGTWTEEGWMEVAMPGDRGLYRNRLTLTKKGSTLTFSNEGSAPQGGTLSGTFAGWKGAVVSMLASQMLFDQMFVIEGALRHCEFEVVPGTITCATRPAAVSGSPALTLLQSIGLGGLVISKMLATSSDEALRSEVQSCMGVLSFPINAIQGVDQRGAPFSSFLLDPVGAALSAYSWRDGQDTGGWPWDLQSTMPNVEETELFYPMLFLWRKELPDSGGAGRWRGGNGAELAFVPHRTDGINLFTITSEVAVPGPGIFGGYPSSTNSFVLVHDAGVAEQIARTGRMPGALSELEGELDMVPAKSFDRRPTPADVWVFGWAGSSGYGDPLRREPSRVADDVAAGRVTADWAEKAYGVVLAADGQPDEDATAARRLAIRTERLGGTPPAREERGDEAGADGAQRLTEYLDVIDGQVRSVPSGRMLGPVAGGYKDGLTRRDLPLTEANPNVRDPSIHTDNAVVFRQLIDPETGTLVATEIVVDGEGLQHDSTIR